MSDTAGGRQGVVAIRATGKWVTRALACFRAQVLEEVRAARVLRAVGDPWPAVGDVRVFRHPGPRVS